MSSSAAGAPKGGRISSGSKESICSAADGGRAPGSTTTSGSKEAIRPAADGGRAPGAVTKRRASARVVPEEASQAWSTSATPVVPTNSQSTAGSRSLETPGQARSDEQEHALEDKVTRTGVSSEWVWYLVRRARLESYTSRLVLYAVFTAIFTAIFHLARPVRASFSIQDALLEQTTRERGIRGFSFYDISSDAEWFYWVQNQLIPTIMDTTFFNGDERAATWGGRFENTVAMYNTQTVPIRFRQARVIDGSCATSPSSSTMARPCWGEFSTGVQLKSDFGESYGNRFLPYLDHVEGYGTAGHVVDMQLDQAVVLANVDALREGLWLNEQTRLVAIETSWYNANHDLSTYVRWQVEITPGGRFRPSVVTYSCRLNPYSTDLDKARLALEVLFLVGLLLYLAEELKAVSGAIKGGAFKRHISSFWNWMEACNLVLYLTIVIWWAAFLLKDKEPYKVVSSEVGAQRPQLSVVARHSDMTANLAAFNIVFSYLKVFKYLQIFPSVGIVWRTLKVAFDDMWPFLFLFFLFTCGFAFAGHWIFGLMMMEFRTWTESFATLCLTLVGGFPYDGMARVAPISAGIFVCLWVIIMAMVLASVFVAILTEWYRRVEEEREEEERRLAKKLGRTDADLVQGLRDVGRRALGLVRRGRRGANGEAHRESSEKAAEMLRSANLRFVGKLHQAVLNGQTVSIKQLAGHFDGSEEKAYAFAQVVQSLEEERSGASAVSGGGVAYFQEQEVDETRDQDRLRELQKQVEGMEANVRRLRGALSESQVAPPLKGQANEGFLMAAFAQPPNSAQVWKDEVEAFVVPASPSSAAPLSARAEPAPPATVPQQPLAPEMATSAAPLSARAEPAPPAAVPRQPPAPEMTTSAAPSVARAEPAPPAAVPRQPPAPEASEAALPPQDAPNAPLTQTQRNLRAAQEAAVLRTQKEEMERRLVNTERTTSEEMARLRIDNARLQAHFEEADARANQEFQRAVKELDEVNRLKLQVKALRESELSLQAKNAELERRAEEFGRKAAVHEQELATMRQATEAQLAGDSEDEAQRVIVPSGRSAINASKGFQQKIQQQDSQLERQRLADQQSLQDRLKSRRMGREDAEAASAAGASRGSR